MTEEQRIEAEIKALKENIKAVESGKVRCKPWPLEDLERARKGLFDHQ